MSIGKSNANNGNGKECGCCEGTRAITPMPIANRPGLDKLKYRVGTHASFLETMKAGLAAALPNLTTRESSDPSIALLDAWAMVADVLTFYQERIANEGYLRTATERRSVLELARLVGYMLRPGVAAGVYLAFELDKGAQVTIPRGSRSQSIPEPGEQMQAFETSHDLQARAEWNNIRPRLTRPTLITEQTADTLPVLYFTGTNTKLTQNDPILIVVGGKRVLRRVASVEVEPLEVDPMKSRTKVTLQGGIQAAPAKPGVASFNELFDSLLKKPAHTPSSPASLNRNLATLLDEGSDTRVKILAALEPGLDERLYEALGNATVEADNPPRVYAMRVKASLFGHNAPKPILYNQDTKLPVPQSNQPEWLAAGDEAENIVFLDNAYGEIKSDGSEGRSYVVIHRPSRIKLNGLNEPSDLPLHFEKDIHAVVKDVEVYSRSAYGVSGKTTRLMLTDFVGSSDGWWKPNSSIATPATDNIPQDGFYNVRGTTVYAQSELLELAEEPVLDPVCDDAIELGELYGGLASGRWLIVSGERVDVPHTTGVMASELVMLAGVDQTIIKSGSSESGLEGSTIGQGAGDKAHTTLMLATGGLSYCYKRDTVTIYGNVVEATHGETRAEPLGSGDGSKSLQSFTLKQSPLTYLPAPTPAGAESTLQVRVDNVLWHEVDNPIWLGRRSHGFVTRTSDDGKTTIVFGDGEYGARLPTGVENVRAVYRTGIGKPGNVRAKQISMLAARPLGVKGVINPMPASGGADPEGRDQARRNAPLAVMALDRLVSVRDYEDFARTYAGIGKASAARLVEGGRELVYLTIAGSDDIPIDDTSELYRNLRLALRGAGDPHQPFRVGIREKLLLAISANVRLHPDYIWEAVEPQIRTALLDTFSFERRELGQDVYLSEAIATIQRVPGVLYADVDLFDVVTLGQLPGRQEHITVNLAGPVESQGPIMPAQIAVLSPDVQDLLILKEITV
jgi:uncharacterized phage protein gp47/JayE